jgi:hypothetical protein
MDKVVKVDKVVKMEDTDTGDQEDGVDMEDQEGTDMEEVEEDQEGMEDLEVMGDMDMGEVEVEVVEGVVEEVGVAFNSFTKSQNIFFTKISNFKIVEYRKY